MNDSPKDEVLRVTLHEHDMRTLMEQFPKLTRTEISDVVARRGPMRSAVLAELEKISGFKH